MIEAGTVQVGLISTAMIFAVSLGELVALASDDRREAMHRLAVLDRLDRRPSYIHGDVVLREVKMQAGKPLGGSLQLLCARRGGNIEFAEGRA